jgi:hypothetical protein
VEGPWLHLFDGHLAASGSLSLRAGWKLGMPRPPLYSPCFTVGSRSPLPPIGDDLREEPEVGGRAAVVPECGSSPC